MSGEWKTTIEISGSLFDGLYLARPVAVDVFTDNGEWVAAVDEFLIHSFGPSQYDAIANLKRDMVEEQSMLNNMRGRLAPQMIRISDLYNEVIRSLRKKDS